MPKVLVPLAQGCEELEAVTVVDLLRRAEFQVLTAGLEEGPVRASRGTVLLPDATLEQIQGQAFDLVALPGGLPGADHLNADERIHRLLRETHARGGWVAAICAAPRVLADAGLLRGRRATSYPEALTPAQREGVRFVEEPVVVDDRVITSRGPGTAMDFALALIEALAGRERREAVEGPLMRPC